MVLSKRFAPVAPSSCSFFKLIALTNLKVGYTFCTARTGVYFGGISLQFFFGGISLHRY